MRNDFLHVVYSSATGTNVGTYTNATFGKTCVTHGESSSSEQVSGYLFHVNKGSLTITKPKVTVTIVGNTAENEYDGASHTASGYTVTSIQINGEDTTLYTEDDFTFTGTASASRTNVVEGTDTDGKTDMGLTSSMFTNNNANFEVTFDVTDGGQVIKPKPVTVTTGSGAKVYDGTPLTNDEASITGLVAGQTATVTATGSQTDVGASENTYDLAWGTAVGTNYTVNEDLGTLTVNQAGLTVTVKPRTLPYNGETQQGFGITGTITGTASAINTNEYTVTGLAEGDVLTVNYTPASGKDAGTYSNGSFTGTVSITRDGEDVTNNYAAPSLNAGTLTIEPINVTVTITGEQVTETYDGTEYTATWSMEASSELYDVETMVEYTADASVSRTEVGTSELGLAANQFSNTNDNFDVTFEVAQDAKVTINQLKVTVTITGANNTTVYDDVSHMVSGYTATASSDLYDVTKDFTFTGNATAIRAYVVEGNDTSGRTYMRLTPEKFTNNNENFDVTFSVTDGYQEIEKAGLLVAVNPKTVPYNAEQQYGYTVNGTLTGTGSALTSDDYQITGLVRGDVLTVSGYTPATGTNADTYNGTLTGIEITVMNGSVDVTESYEIGASAGTLTIERVPLTITAKPQEYVYNGEIQGPGDAAYDDRDEIAKLVTVEGLQGSDALTSIIVDGQGEDADTYDLVPQQAAINEAKGNDNYDITYVNGEMRIKPLEVTVTITGHTLNVLENGKEQSVEGYDVEIGDPLYTEDDFKFSGEAVASGTDPKEYPMGLKADQFANDNKNFVVTFDVTDGSLVITPLGGGKSTPTVSSNYGLGDLIPFTIIVMNNSETDAEGVLVEDPNATIVAGTGYRVDDGVAIIDTLPAGGRVIVSARHEVTAEDVAAASVGNTAIIRYGDATLEVSAETDQIATEHTLTIRYWFDRVNGRTAARTYTGTYRIGSRYDVTSPGIAGYSADRPRVRGTISGDTVIDVIYTADTYTLRVVYVYQTGEQAAPTHTEVHAYNETYRVASPVIPGYTASETVVSGTMPERDMTLTVVYLADDANANLIVIEDFDTPLGLANMNVNAGEAIE